jgi:hypothetical protein
MRKRQEVMWKAMAKQIPWWPAAERRGVTEGTRRRWRERREAEGYKGLADRRPAKPSFRRLPLATGEEGRRLDREGYPDLNRRHFHETRPPEPGLEWSDRGGQPARPGAGLVAPRGQRGAPRRRRPRRPRPGLWRPRDGRQPRWRKEERGYDLRVMRDEATSEIYSPPWVAEESTRTVRAAGREGIETQGLFGAR